MEIGLELAVVERDVAQDGAGPEIAFYERGGGRVGAGWARVECWVALEEDGEGVAVGFGVACCGAWGS